MKKIVLLFILSFSFSFGQNIVFKKIAEIDSLCSSINKLKKSEYKTLQSSGVIKKKKFIFFNKTVGGFNQDVTFANNKILKITYVEFLKDKVKNERFYFSDNKLVKYEIRTFDKTEIEKSEINSNAYFENEKLIKFWSDKETEFNALKIFEQAKELNSNYLEFIKINLNRDNNTQLP